MNRIKKLFTYLKENGFDVYTPGQKQGECTSSYLVIKSDGSTKTSAFSTAQDTFTIMCYVPKNKYSTLEEYVNNVYEVMKGLKPLFKSTEERTPSFYDDSCKAHMTSLSYISNRKL